MDEIIELADYLPCSLNNSEEMDYLSFLWNTVEQNYKNKNYHFATLAFHMLYMTFIYSIVWKIKKSRIECYDKAIIFLQIKKKEDIDSPFRYSEANEKSFFDILQLLKCTKADIGNYKKFVETRNNISHSNGSVYFKDEESFSKNIRNIIKCVKEIQEKTENILQDLFKSFLNEICEYNKEDIPSLIETDLIHKNYLSLKDLKLFTQMDITKFKKHTNYKKIRIFFNQSVKEIHDKYLSE